MIYNNIKRNINIYIYIMVFTFIKQIYNSIFSNNTLIQKEPPKIIYNYNERYLHNKEKHPTTVTSIYNYWIY